MRLNRFRPRADVVAVGFVLAIACGKPASQPTRQPVPTATASGESELEFEPGEDRAAMLTARSHGHCGVERWSVKVGQDQGASSVPLTRKATTIASLSALAPPSPLPPDDRVPSTESTVFKVSATLTGFKREADSDYHLVIQDAGGATLIIEIPDPACMAGSPWQDSVKGVRAAFDTQFGTVTGKMKHVSVPVTVVGVGFFDFIHGQTGAAPNGIELHPVLAMCFTAGCEP